MTAGDGAAPDKRSRGVPPAVWLALAVTLFGAATPLLKALVDRGGHFGTMLVNAISYCNVLFVGNVCSALLVLAIYRPRRVLGGLRELSRRQWGALLANTLLANVLAPTLIINALEATTATAVILLLQTDVVFLALCGKVFFREAIPARTWTGLLMIGAGAALLAWFAGEGAALTGAVSAIAAAGLRSLGNAAARVDLAKEETLPAFLFVRNLLGAAVFFGLAIWMFGPNHFADAFSPGLWELMVVYGAVVVLLGQLSWYRAVAALPGSTVSAAWTLAPVVSLAFAYLLLRETPTALQWASVGLVFAGLGLAQLGKRKPEARPAAVGAERSLAGAA